MISLYQSCNAQCRTFVLVKCVYRDVLVMPSAVVDTTFVDIYVDTKNIPTCRYNIQHIDKRTMENKMSIIM